MMEITFHTGTAAQIDGSHLDTPYRWMREGGHAEAMNYLGPTLRDARLSATEEEWGQLVNVMLRHPIRLLLHEDPLTSRAFRRPRGYAGDAQTMDLIYGHPAAAALSESATPAGRTLYQYTSATAISRATRNRKRRLAATIDDAVRRGARTALSVACGHLRELELVSNPDAITVTGLDQDATSLAEVAGCYRHLDVRTINWSVRDFIRRPLPRAEFDLAYSAGLFDYLSDRTGRAVLSRMLRCTAPGGTVLVANIMPAYPEVGYMESFMNWPLIKRTPADMERLVEGPASNMVDTCVCDSDEYDTYAFMTLRRR